MDIKRLQSIAVASLYKLYEIKKVVELVQIGLGIPTAILFVFSPESIIKYYLPVIIIILIVDVVAIILLFRTKTVQGIVYKTTNEPYQYNLSHSKKFKSFGLIGLLALNLPIILLVNEQESQISTNFKIYIANFEGPETKKYRFTETILEKLQDLEKQYKDIEVFSLNKVITTQMGRKEAIRIFQEKEADLLIWGWYTTTKKGMLTVKYEIKNKPTIEGLSFEDRTFYYNSIDIDTVGLQFNLAGNLSSFVLFITSLYYKGIHKDKEAFDRLSAAIKLTNLDYVINKSYLYTVRGNFQYNQSLNDAIQDYSHAISIDTNFLSPYYNRCVAYTRIRKYDEALNDINYLIRKIDNNCEYYSQRALLYLMKRDYVNAENDYAKSIKVNSNYVYGYINRANIFVLRKEYQRAKIDLKKAIQINSNLSEPHHSLGIIHLIEGNMDSSLLHFNRAIELDPYNSRGYLNRGNFNFFNEQYDQAITDFEMAKSRNPTNPYIYSALSFSYAYKGNISGIFDNMAMATKIDSSYFINYIKLYNMFLQTESNISLMAIYNILKNQPNNLDALIGYTTILLKDKDYNEYSKLYDRIRSISKEGAGYVEAEYQYRRGNNDESERLFKNLVQKDYKKNNCLLKLAQIYMRTKDYSKGTKTLTHILNEIHRSKASRSIEMQNLLFSKDTTGWAVNRSDNYFISIVYGDRGLCYLSQKKISLAESDFKKSLEYNKRNTSTLSGLGDLYLATEQYQNALTNFITLSAIEPAYFYSYTRIALALYKLQEFNQALGYIDIALTLNKKDFSSYFYRGQINNALGRYKQAVEDFKMVLYYRPNDEAAIKELNMAKSKMLNRSTKGKS